MQLMDIHRSFVCFHTIESIGELNSGDQNYPFGRYVPHWRIIEWNDQCELCVKWENFHFSGLPLQKLLELPFLMSRMWDIDHNFVKAASFFPLVFSPLWSVYDHFDFWGLLHDYAVSVFLAKSTNEGLDRVDAKSFLRSMSTYFQAGEPRALSMNSNIKSHLLPKNRSIHGHGFDVWRDRELEIARVTWFSWYRSWKWSEDNVEKNGGDGAG